MMFPGMFVYNGFRYLCVMARICRRIQNAIPQRGGGGDNGCYTRHVNVQVSGGIRRIFTGV